MTTKPNEGQKRFHSKQYEARRPELLKIRRVEARWAILTKMIGMGLRPHRADLAGALYDHINLEKPRIVPRAILVALLGEFIREGRGGRREMTVDQFLSRVDAPVQLSRLLHHKGRLAKEKGAYDTALEETRRKFGMSKNTLETLRKQYNQMVKRGDYED